MTGAAIAERLAADGHFVIIVFRSDKDAANAVEHRIRAAGGKAQTVCCPRIGQFRL